MGASPSVSDTLNQLASFGLSAEQQLKVLQLIEAQNDVRRAKQREATRRWREKKYHRDITETLPSDHRDITVVSPETKPEAANPLKVSRNFDRGGIIGGEEDKKEDKVLFGSSVPEEPQRATASHSEYDFTSNSVPDIPGTIITFPAPSKPVAPSVNPRSALFELAKTLLGKSGTAAVVQLLRLLNDDVPRVKRVFELAIERGGGDISEMNRYVYGTIERQKKLLKQEELDRKQVAEWRPTKAQFPPRDETHPKQPYYTTSKVDGKKRLHLDTERVHREVYDLADRTGATL